MNYCKHLTINGFGEGFHGVAETVYDRLPLPRHTHAGQVLGFSFCLGRLDLHKVVTSPTKISVGLGGFKNRIAHE